jgi:hypothetical protein
VQTGCQLTLSSVLNSSMPISQQKGDVTSQDEARRKRSGTQQCPSWIALTNLAPMQALAFDAGRKTTELPMLPAKERKAIFKRMCQSGLSAKQVKRKGRATAMGEAKAKEKEKGNSVEIGIGKEKGTQGMKPPCANYSKGNGYCKWEDNCRFSHDGPKGGKRKSTSMATKVTAKKQKKQMMSMLVKVLDEVEGKE